MADRLIIVSRDEPALYHALREDWAADDTVTVMLDRRLTERRRQAVTTEVERRRRDRRAQAPLDVFLTWKGGGANARRADVLSALDRGAGHIAVRHKPGAKAPSRTLTAGTEDGRQPSPMRQAAIGAPPHAVVALVILLGTLTGGVFGGLALWLLLACEFPPPGGINVKAGPPPHTASPRRGLRAWLSMGKARHA